MEIHRADPQLRRATVLFLVVAVAAGGAGYWLLREWLAGLSLLPLASAQSQLAAAFGWCMGLACLTLGAFAAYLWSLGTRVVAFGQFPLPGARLLRDTPILRGPPARRRGRWLQRMGAALFACAAGLAVMAWRLHAGLASSAV